LRADENNSGLDRRGGENRAVSGGGFILRAINVLEELANATHHAGHLADLVAGLCARGESIDQAVSDLADRVDRITALVVADNADLDWATEPVARQLIARLAVATTVAEARKAAVATELEALAQRDRVDRTYRRPPG
jgi:hypothetical protein